MIEREIERFVLSAHPKMTGRAVDLRALLPSEVDAVAKDAAVLAGRGDEPKQQVDFMSTVYWLGVSRCIMRITRARVPMIKVAVQGKDGKPKQKPVLDDDGRPELGDNGKPKMEDVTADEPDPAWLAKPENWITPDRQMVEMPGGYDALIGNPKDDGWLTAWWRDTHEVSAGQVQRIMEKAQRVSSG